MRRPRGEWHTVWNAGPAPVRLLAIISPAGFERHFDELAGLTTPNAPAPGIPGIVAPAERYGLEIDPAAIGPLLAGHALRFG